MNHQIRLLAEQATKKYDRLGNEIPFAQPDLEKFAELIVRECEKVAKDGAWYYDTPSLRSGWQNPINHVCNVMREHFGVEE